MPLAWFERAEFHVSEDFASEAFRLPPIHYLDCLARITDLEAANRLAPKRAKVLRAVVMLALEGDTTPSLAKLGVEAKCASRRTVQRAKQDGVRLGLIAVDEQYPIAAGVPFRRPDRLTVLAPPTDPVRPKPKNRPKPPACAPQCQVGTTRKESLKPSALPVLEAEDKWKTRGQNDAGDALAAARARVLRKMEATSAAKPRIEIDRSPPKRPPWRSI